MHCSSTTSTASRPNPLDEPQQPRIHPHSKTTVRPHPGRLPFPQFHTWEGMGAYHKEDRKNLWPGGLPKTEKLLTPKPVLTEEEERKVKFYQLRPEKTPPVEVQRNMKKLERWSALCVAPSDIVQNITAAELDPTAFLGKLSKMKPTWSHRRESSEVRAQNDRILQEYAQEMRSQRSIPIVQGDPDSGTYCPPNFPEGAESYGSFALPGAPGNLAAPITRSKPAAFPYRSLANDFVMHRENPHWATVLEKRKQDDRRAEQRRERQMAFRADKIRKEAAQRQREEAEMKLQEKKRKEREETERLQREYAEKEAKRKQKQMEEAAEKERKRQNLLAERRRIQEAKEQKLKEEQDRISKKRWEEEIERKKKEAEERVALMKKKRREVKVVNPEPVKKAPTERNKERELVAGRVILELKNNISNIRLSRLVRMRLGKINPKRPLQVGASTGLETNIPTLIRKRKPSGTYTLTAKNNDSSVKTDPNSDPMRKKRKVDIASHSKVPTKTKSPQTTNNTHHFTEPTKRKNDPTSHFKIPAKTQSKAMETDHCTEVVKKIICTKPRSEIASKTKIPQMSHNRHVSSGQHVNKKIDISSSRSEGTGKTRIPKAIETDRFAQQRAMKKNNITTRPEIASKTNIPQAPDRDRTAECTKKDPIKITSHSKVAQKIRRPPTDNSTECPERNIDTTRTETKIPQPRDDTGHFLNRTKKTTIDTTTTSRSKIVPKSKLLSVRDTDHHHSTERTTKRKIDSTSCTDGAPKAKKHRVTEGENRKT